MYWCLGCMCVYCEGDGSAGVGFEGGVVSVSAGDVLEISVVRGVGGVYDMCMCVAWGGRCWG